MTAFQRYIEDSDSRLIIILFFIEYEVEIVQSVPQQMNGNDCGLCTCLNMEMMRSKGGDPEKIQYSMDNEQAKEFRRRVAVELMFGKIIE